MAEVSTPSPKRKSTGYLEYFSPAKKIRTNFQQNLNFWETKNNTIINNLASNYMAGPSGGLAAQKSEHNGIGGKCE